MEAAFTPDVKKVENAIFDPAVYNLMFVKDLEADKPKSINLEGLLWLEYANIRHKVVSG